MNNLESFGSIEKTNFEANSLVVKEKMNVFNKAFQTKLTSENGIYGITEAVKDNGVIQRTGKNEFGHSYKEYITSEGRLFLRRENYGNHNIATTYYDDNETAYLRKITKLENNTAVSSSKLMPGITVTKGNFSAVTDNFGRPIINRITDLAIKETGRESLNSINRGDDYRVNDHKGHLIADSFGGPASQENIVAMNSNVNQGKFAQIENLIREYKADGKSVDYEVRTNYAGSDGRPTSFEAKITVDGKIVELPDELKKIYNEAESELTTGKKIQIEAGEKFGVANELGLKNAVVAAGITITVSTVENVSAYIDGDISAEEMVVDIVQDTAIAGTVAYGTTFVSTAVSQAMSKSSSALIQNVGNSCIPAAVVSFGVQSYEDISDFAQGKIDGGELAYNLGENAAGVAGSMIGGAAGGTAGAIAGPIGSFAGSIVGGTVGCAIAVEAYQTAVELGTEGAEILADKAQELANSVIDSVSTAAPEVLNDVKGAFADFAASVKLPFSLG